MAEPAGKKREQGFDLLSLLGLSGGGSSGGGGGTLAGLLKQSGILDMLAGIPIIGPMLVASLEQQSGPDPQVAAAVAKDTEKAAFDLKIVYNTLTKQTSPEAKEAAKNIQTALESLSKGELKLTEGFRASAEKANPPPINSATGLAKTVNAAFAGGINENSLALVVPLATPALELAGKEDTPPLALTQASDPGPKR